MAKEKNSKKIRPDKYQQKVSLSGELSELLGILAKDADRKVKDSLTVKESISEPDNGLLEVESLL